MCVSKGLVFDETVPRDPTLDIASHTKPVVALHQDPRQAEVKKKKNCMILHQLRTDIHTHPNYIVLDAEQAPSKQESRGFTSCQQTHTGNGSEGQCIESCLYCAVVLTNVTPLFGTGREEDGQVEETVG